MAKIKFDSPQEQERFHAKESWVPVIFGGIPVAMVCAIVSVLLVHFAHVDVAICVLASILIVLISRVPHIVDNWRTDVMVSDRRLYYRHGIIDIKDHVTDLGSITDVTVDPSILGRIFNYANVRIQTKAGDDDFVLKEIGNAYEMRGVINTGRDSLEDAAVQPQRPPARRPPAR
ncbi:MAG: PH domain-containing protein [Atopobiaceae bacterium]|nr:PH domain-containing protein [Atopobiaceae bacterium]